MAALKCLVVKSTRGYVDALKIIVTCIVDFWNFVWHGKFTRDGFVMFSRCLGMLCSSLGCMIMLHPPMPDNMVGAAMLAILGAGIGLPLILIPIYSAVFDCFVDENLKEIEK